MKNKVPFYKLVLYSLLILFFLLIFYKCPFKFFLGIPCFGCGMTRALISCLRLDFIAAFYYHPLFGFVIIAGILWCFNYLGIKILSHKLTQILGYTLCALFVIVYFVRLFTGSDIVCIDFKESLIYKIIEYIYNKKTTII